MTGPYPVRKSLTLAAADADGIAKSQTPAGAGALTLNGDLISGGVYTADVARRIIVVTVSNESSKTVTITGTNIDDIAQVETMTGPNATTGVSTKDFKTVTSVVVSAAFTGAVTIGTNGKASTAWIVLDPSDIYGRHHTGVALSVELTSGASLNFTVEHTFDDVQDLTFISSGTSTITVFANSSTALASATANADGGYIVSPIAVRLTINTFTSGTATITVV